MSLQDVYDSDLAAIYAEQGVDCVYTPQGASALPGFPIILDEALAQSFHDGSHVVEFLKRSARVRVADLATVKIGGKDGAGDSLVINSKTWYVCDWMTSGESSREHEIELTDKHIGKTRGR